MGCISINKKSKRSKYKNNLNNVKSVYILRKIFDIIPKNKNLEIIRYNKKLQKKLDLSINDYKEYPELYTSIELEIKPVYCEYGKFIKISDSDKEYYHTYFDDNKEEIKRNYLNKEDKVNKIKIIMDYQVKSFKKLFFGCTCVESVYFKKFYRNNITDMSYMFSECSALKELNLSNFNTINVTNMSHMFCFCSSLIELNISNFNTTNVTNMSWMFDRCPSLKELNLSNFNTVNVTDMSCMFSFCKSLKELNLSNFNTINVTNMRNIFSNCSSLKELNLSNFNTNNVTNMLGMFDGCTDNLKDMVNKQNNNIYYKN